VLNQLKIWRILLVLIIAGLALVIPFSVLAAFNHQPTVPSEKEGRPNPLNPVAGFIGINGAVCSYSSFTTAISDANPGDTLYIAQGTHHTRIGLIDKNLNLRAASSNCTTPDPTQVTIDADNAAATHGGVAEIDSGLWVTMTGLILTNGSAAYGGILYMNTNDHLLLDNTTVLSGSALTSGGGIDMITGTLELMNDSEVISNTSGSFGGGVRMDWSTLILRDTSRVGDLNKGNSTGTYGGGVFAYQSNIQMYDSSRIRGNDVSSDGGGLYLEGGSLQMFDDSRIRTNTASGSGGGINAKSNALIQMFDTSTIGGNGAIFGNHANVGGGVYLLDDGTSMEMNEGSGVVYNTADTSGGGVFVDMGSNLQTNGAHINHNSATNNSGGGVYSYGFTTVLTLTNTTLRYNDAVNGGGLFAAFASRILIQSQFITYTLPMTSASPVTGYCNPFSLDSDRYCSEIRENTASNKGGALGFSGSANITIRHTAVMSNTASQAAAFELGNAFQGGNITVENSLIADNIATDVVTPSIIHGNPDYFGYINATFNQVTIADNEGVAFDFNPHSNVVLTNTIIYFKNNVGYLNGTVDATCNDTQNTILPGSGNISIHPVLVPTSRGKYHLYETSPVNDQCDSGLGPDLDNIPRPREASYDMGAFEYFVIRNIYLPLVLK
jgi:hypothetical protein